MQSLISDTVVTEHLHTVAEEFPAQRFTFPLMLTPLQSFPDYTTILLVTSTIHADDRKPVQSFVYLLKLPIPLLRLSATSRNMSHTFRLILHVAPVVPTCANKFIMFSPFPSISHYSLQTICVKNHFFFPTGIWLVASFLSISTTNM